MNCYNCYNFYLGILTCYKVFTETNEYFKGLKFTTAILLYKNMDQYFKHNGIPLRANFVYLNFDSILA
jgi:hypothetical protein